MHIRDGILSPEVCLATGTLAVAAVGFSLRQLRTRLADQAIPLTGMVAAVVFAGQMVNFPLFGLPVSGHLLGGVLAAAILGPWAGCIALTVVLLVQAVLFADGGLLSFGGNVRSSEQFGGGPAVICRGASSRRSWRRICPCSRPRRSFAWSSRFPSAPLHLICSNSRGSWCCITP